jgi:hypothetical protein
MAKLFFLIAFPLVPFALMQFAGDNRIALDRSTSLGYGFQFAVALMFAGWMFGVVCVVCHVLTDDTTTA